MSDKEPAKKQSILVVDDIESIRNAIAEFLSPYYRSLVAEDGFTALEILKQEKVDLLITDIRMPGMGGLQLCKYVQKDFPETKLALMTAFNPNDYIRFVREEGIWNLIPKSTSLELPYIKVMADKLLAKDSDAIFGIQNYFPDTPIREVGFADIHKMHRNKWPLNIEGKFYITKIESTQENSAVCDMIGDILIEHGAPSVLRMILEELTANAIIHAPRVREKIKEAMLRHTEEELQENALELIELDKEDAFYLGFGIIEEHLVFSISDSHGSFDRNKALECLERQTAIDPKTGLPLGLVDYHGRGLYICREQLDQLVFNIEPGKRTEIIGILDLNEDIRTRAISIYSA